MSQAISDWIVDIAGWLVLASVAIWAIDSIVGRVLGMVRIARWYRAYERERADLSAPPAPD